MATLAPAVINDTELAFTISVCQSSLWDFVQHFWEQVPGSGTMIANWHMERLCQELQTVAERVFRGEPKHYDVIFNVSPGTSKSTICSILFPAWTWTRMPHARHLTASHTDTLVMDLANKSRWVIKSEKYQSLFPYIQLRADQDTKSYFANTLGGDRLTCTVAGKSPMGFHGHFLTVDDPIDPKKAVSEAELKSASYFFDAVLPGRKVNKEVSVIFLIIQRLHTDDPTGHLLARTEGAGPITHLGLPTDLAENVEPVELREEYVDGLMDPKRLPRAVLRREAITMGSYAFSGQFMQSPIPLGGGMFKETYFNQRIKAAPYHSKRIRYWDRACLVWDTKVETFTGPKPIQEIVAGDYVLTRQGYKRVKWAGPTKKVADIVSVRFSNGTTVTGTADHRVWTQNRGWIELASLRSDDYNLYYERVQSCVEKDAGENWILRPSSSMASPIPGGQANATLSPTVGIRKGNVIGPIPFTVSSGATITVIFPVATTYITATATGTITKLETLSASPEPSTIGNMGFSAIGTRRQPTVNITRSLWRLVEKLKGIGRLAESLVINVARIFGRNTLTLNVYASVPGCVVSVTGIDNSGAGVAFAASPSLDVYKRIIAHDVEDEWVVKHVTVYDLEVEDAHEFFANGILVHNSTQDGGCYTAGVLLAKDEDGSYFVEHVVHGQWEPDERNQRMRATALRDRARYGPRADPVIWVEAEGGSSGRDAWKGVARALVGFNVREDRVTGKKEVRAEPWACQCAAKTVWLVEDGSWDINGYIAEHCQFPLGKRNDMVDASTGAFNLLTNVRQTGVMRIFAGVKSNGKALLRCVVCSREQLATLLIEQPSLLVSMVNPLLNGQEVNYDMSLAPQGQGTDLSRVAGQSPPVHGLNQLLDYLCLEFADFDPVDYQDRWTELEPTYGRTIDQLIMNQQHGKILWSFLLRKRSLAAEVFVLVDDADRRALSLAYALCDVLHLPRAGCIYRVDEEDWHAATADEPPNRHVYLTAKAGRNLVV